MAKKGGENEKDDLGLIERFTKAVENAGPGEVQIQISLDKIMDVVRGRLDALVEERKTLLHRISHEKYMKIKHRENELKAMEVREKLVLKLCDKYEKLMDRLLEGALGKL